MNPSEREAIKLVAIDDDPQSLELIGEALSDLGLEILTAGDPREGLEIVLRARPEIVLLDMLMPGMTGLEVLERITETSPNTDVILVTGHYSAQSAVEAIRKGASDYIQKPVDILKLRERIGQLMCHAQQRQRAAQLDRELLQAWQFEGMVGRSPQMLAVFAAIRRSAPHYRTAMITGATGTGKELVARAMHRCSPVAGGRFAVCNSSAIVESLFESELFGHVRGAFTGATQDRPGLFEYAARGTVFLDEIGDMPMSTQSKLLRVLETGEYQPVGSPAARRTDVRVIAATNRDLRELMGKGQFREDLYYRLSMLEIHLPSLGERKEDLPLLERYFIEEFAALYGKPVRDITPRAQLVLARYRWPGNVRELRNVLGRACMMAEGESLDVRDLPDHVSAGTPPETNEEEELLTLDEVYRRHVRRVLDRVSGNKMRAAKILGIHRATLHRLLSGDKQ